MYEKKIRSYLKWSNLKSSRSEPMNHVRKQNIIDSSSQLRPSSNIQSLSLTVHCAFNWLHPVLGAVEAGVVLLHVDAELVVDLGEPVSDAGSDEVVHADLRVEVLVNLRLKSVVESPEERLANSIKEVDKISWTEYSSVWVTDIVDEGQVVTILG